MSTIRKAVILAGCAAAFGAGMAVAQDAGYGGPYGFGETATEEEIAAVDIDAMPDGRGLPPASGTYEQGKEVYMTQCVACHGEKLEGNKEMGGDTLVGGRGSLAGGSPSKTIESYWPYATTVFDYVKRAMPFQSPGSLSDDDVYAVTAYILGEANIIEKSQVIDAKSLPQVQMPNRDGFVSDPRPDVRDYE